MPDRGVIHVSARRKISLSGRRAPAAEAYFDQRRNWMARRRGGFIVRHRLQMGATSRRRIYALRHSPVDRSSSLAWTRHQAALRRRRQGPGADLHPTTLTSLSAYCATRCRRTSRRFGSIMKRPRIPSNRPPLLCSASSPRRGWCAAREALALKGKLRSLSTSGIQEEDQQAPLARSKVWLKRSAGGCDLEVVFRINQTEALRLRKSTSTPRRVRHGQLVDAAFTVSFPFSRRTIDCNPSRDRPPDFAPAATTGARHHRRGHRLHRHSDGSRKNRHRVMAALEEALRPVGPRSIEGAVQIQRFRIGRHHPQTREAVTRADAECAVRGLRWHRHGEEVRTSCLQRNLLPRCGKMQNLAHLERGDSSAARVHPEVEDTEVEQKCQVAPACGSTKWKSMSERSTIIVKSDPAHCIPEQFDITIKPIPPRSHC